MRQGEIINSDLRIRQEMMSSNLVTRKPQSLELSRHRLFKSQKALKKALAEDYDDEWEDAEDDVDYDSGLGSSSSSERQRPTNAQLQRFELARRKRHIKMSRRLIMKQSTVVDMLGGTGDPFAAMPQTITGADRLVYHWNNVLAHAGVAGPRKDWFPFALQHPALFQATLFVAAASLDTLNGRRMPALFLSYRGEIIRTISSRLEDPDLAATDSTIGAVAMIYMVDAMRFHKEVALTHLQGLQQLIYARGGMELLDPRVQVMIKLVDLLGSAYLREPPHFDDSRFENVTPVHLYGHPSISTIKLANAFAARLSSFTGDSVTADFCATIYWGLRNLTVIIESRRSKLHEEIEYSTRAEFLEREVRRVMDGLESKMREGEAESEASGSHSSSSGTKISSKTKPIGLVPSASSKYSDSQVFTIFGTAARIYIYTVLQQLDTKLPVFPMLASTLEESLVIMGDARLKTLLGTFPDLMLWALFLGGNAAPWGRKGWFAKTATRVLLVKKVEMKKGVEDAREAFLWPEGRANYDSSVMDVGS